MDRELQVCRIGVFLVDIGLLGVGDAVLLQIIQGGVVDVGAVGHLQGRGVAVIAAVVVGHRHRRAGEGRAVVAAHGEGRSAVGGAVVEDGLIEHVATAHGIDLVAVGLLLVRGLDREVGQGGEAAPRRRRRRVVGEVVGQPVLQHRFCVAGDVGAEIVAVVVVGLEVELAAIAEPAPVIVVLAQLQVLVVAGDAGIVVVLLDVVEAAEVVAPGRGEHEGERGRVRHPADPGLRGIDALHHQPAIGEAEPGAAGQVDVEGAGVVVFRLVAPAQGAFEERSGDVGGGARGQLHRAAQALGLVVGQGGLGDDDAVDGPRRHGVVLHRPAAAAEIGAPRIGVQQRHGTEGRTGQVAVNAADVDEAAFARVGGDGDARDSAQGLGGIEVRVFLDGFRGLHRDQVGGVLLLPSGGDLDPRRGDDHALHGVGGGVRRRGVRGRGHGGDEAGTRQQGQAKRKARHENPRSSATTRSKAQLTGFSTGTATNR